MADQLSKMGATIIGFNFTIYGCGGHLGHVTSPIYINFSFPFPWLLHINLALIGQVVSEIFENGGQNQRTDARGCLYYKLTL